MPTDPRASTGGAQPLVSVVIPTYNRAHQVGAAIDSALAQSYSPIEVVVVDDGSTDGVRALLDGYGSRITAIHQANAGLSAARNRGIREAHGELVAFLDDDDSWRPNKLELQVPLFTDPDVHLVHSAGHFYNDDGTWSNVQFVGEHIDFHAMLRFKVIYVQTVIVRRSVFDTVGFFDEALRSAEDWDMWLRIALKYPLTGQNECVADIRCNPEGMQANLERVYTHLMKVMKRHAGDHGDCPECRSAIRATTRQIRGYYYGKCKERAQSAIRQRNYIQAIRLRCRAFRYDPFALPLLPYNAFRRLVARFTT